MYLYVTNLCENETLAYNINFKACVSNDEFWEIHNPVSLNLKILKRVIIKETLQWDSVITLGTIFFKSTDKV